MGIAFNSYQRVSKYLALNHLIERIKKYIQVQPSYMRKY